MLTAAGPDTGVACYPRKPYVTGTRRGVILCHGYGATALSAIDSGWLHLTKKLTDHAECVAVSGTLAGNNWGNDAGITAMTACFDWLVSSSSGRAKTAKVIVVGASMGSITAINWATRNPTKVAALALPLLLPDMTELHTTNPSGMQASMNTAHGGTPNFATRDPALIADDLVGIPTAAWHPTDDPLVPNQADYTAFAAASGAELHSMGAVGHTLSAVNANELLTFVAPYL